MKVLEFAESTEQSEEIALRVYVQGGRTSYEYGFKFGQRQENDVVIAQDGFDVLVDGFSFHLLRGASVDFVQSVSGGGFSVNNPNEPDPSNDPLFARVQNFINDQINPGVQTHGGHVTLLEVKDGVAFVELGGGCQGCGMVDVTLRDGVIGTLQRAVPEISEVLDTTDHESGDNPYY